MILNPVCGTDLRRSTKAVAMIDSVLTGVSIFCGITVLNGLATSVKDPDCSSWPIGSVVLHIVLMATNIYLDFRLYRAAHERDLERLRVWKKTVGIILGLGTVLVLLVRHTVDRTDPSSRYPLLWFYVIYFVTAVFRTYMFWIVWIFIGEFELP